MLPYKSDGYTRRKIKIKPPRETNLGVVSFAALIAAAKEANLGVAAA